MNCLLNKYSSCILLYYDEYCNNYNRCNALESFKVSFHDCDEKYNLINSIVYRLQFYSSNQSKLHINENNNISPPSASISFLHNLSNLSLFSTFKFPLANGISKNKRM